METEIIRIWSRVEPNRFALCRWRIHLSVERRTKEGHRSSHRLIPQKVRPEDGGERWRTTNRSMRVPAELCSMNLNGEPHFLHRKTTRIRRSWEQVRNPVGASESCSERGFERAMKALNHSITRWWKLIVIFLKIPRMEQTSDQMKDVNWEPRSEVRRAGTLNLKTHVDMKARAQASEVMEKRRTWRFCWSLSGGN